MRVCTDSTEIRATKRRTGSIRTQAGVLLALLALAIILTYIPFGHGVVRALYDRSLPFSDRLMAHRATTPLLDYFIGADAMVLKLVAILFGTAILLTTNDWLGPVLSVITLLASSVALFFLIDSSPPLAKTMHFDVIPYFNFRQQYIPDAELGFIERPLRHAEAHNWRGSAYSPAYGIDVPPVTEILETDEQGFRNQRGRSRADVVVLGSSFPPYGKDLDDTYAKRLEKHLGGYTVADLAMGGYGPVEFVKVFERFGLPKKPRYAILAFQTGDIENSLYQYVKGEDPPSVTFRKTAFGGFWQRWLVTAHETRKLMVEGLLGAFGALVDYGTLDRPKPTHPDVTVLKLPRDVTHLVVLLPSRSARPAEESLQTPEWRLFEKVLRDFKRISERNQITPMLAYIPFATEIYAKYSTPESGFNWMSIRETQVATSAEDELAARRTAEQVGIPLISFLPSFEDAARRGRYVYLQLDVHWNSEGSEIAARVTAEALQAEMAAVPGHP